MGSLRLVTAQEVAEALTVSAKSIYRWAQEGRIPSVSLGRAKRFDLEAILQAVREGTLAGKRELWMPWFRKPLPNSAGGPLPSGRSI